MNDEFVVTRVLERIDTLDAKMDGQIGKMDDKIVGLVEDVSENGKEIALVKKDLENHLENKKEETEGFKRRVYFVTAVLGAAFGMYAAFKEFIH